VHGGTANAEVFLPFYLNSVYTIQPVVKLVWQPVGQPAASCKQTSNRLSYRLTTGWMFVYTYNLLSNRLSNHFDNRFDNRLYRVNGTLRYLSMCLQCSVVFPSLPAIHPAWPYHITGGCPVHLRTCCNVNVLDCRGCDQAIVVDKLFMPWMVTHSLYAYLYISRVLFRYSNVVAVVRVVLLDCELSNIRHN